MELRRRQQSRATARPTAPANGAAASPPRSDAVLQSDAVINQYVSWDVTADVATFLSGTANYGWMIRKDLENQNGNVDYGAREAATNRPRLVLEVVAPTSTATAYRHQHADGDRHRHVHRHRHAHRDPHPDRHTHPDADADVDAHAHRHADAHARSQLPALPARRLQATPRRQEVAAADQGQGWRPRQAAVEVDQGRDDDRRRISATRRSTTRRTRSASTDEQVRRSWRCRP